MALEFITSEKGKRKLCVNGYLYYQDKKANTKIYWKCDKYYKLKCGARITTQEEIILLNSGTHNHIANAAEIEGMKMMNNIRDHAKRTQDAPHFIVSTASVGVSQAAAAILPKVSSIKRTIRNVRTKHEAAPALPVHRSDIVIPENYKNTKNGEEFLLFDSGPTEDRLLIFSTRRNLRLLAQAEHWYADGTFKTVPHLFHQLYTIHGLHDNIAVPLLYTLLPDKTKNTYIRLLQKLKELMPGTTPRTILTDFEYAMIEAVAQEFPRSRQRGCFFHFTQCIFRKIQSEGLKQRYETDAEFALKLRLLSAIAFVPAANVVDAFEILCDENVLPAEAQRVVDYFEDIWIGRPQRRQRRRAPYFPHDMWNCFDGVNEGLPKTNNSIEGWHRGFEQQISADHPSIWKFIEAIQREQSLHELQIEQYIGGLEGPPTRKKYRDCAERIARIVANYDQRNIYDFLRGIAHNISY